MTIGANSYGSVAEVVALTRVYLGGQSSFTTETRPTLTEVEKFIDRASGVLNLALANQGFTTPVSQADAKLACDQWVVEKAVAMVTAYAEQPAEAALWLGSLHRSAVEFVDSNETGFKTLGVGVTDSSSAAVAFTGETAQADRADPDNTAIEQPSFSRKQFDS